MAIGASFVEQGGFAHLQGLVGGRLRWIEAGTGGERSDEILARFETDVLDLDPKVVLIDSGGNDILQDVANATIEANNDEMYDLAVANGISVYTSSIQVFSSNYAPATAARVTRRLEMNDIIQSKGFPYFDYGVAVGDGTTPNPDLLAEYDTGDHLHLNLAGRVRQSASAFTQLFGGEVWR